MKPTDVKGNTYIDFGKEVNENDPKFKIGHRMRISKYKNIFLRAILQIGQKKFLGLRKLRI